MFAYNHRRLRVSWYAERSTFSCLWVTLDADVEISNKENHPGPVLIDLLCATNLLASQILAIKIMAETLRSSIDVLNLQLTVTLELLVGRLSILYYHHGQQTYPNNILTYDQQKICLVPVNQASYG